ncbi:unnamed protein product [Microthlaspi erraticum]|uniref:Tf2-1-like SH3-like domain-containing protein n=1 Tax=Microthlaspi erraticum TaxID=1685480 RepID=A0A6D2HMK6_9BRAS|nr:unnamed protein product [Microthlaspi erraticum]
MECQLVLCQTVIPDSLQSFGELFRQRWALRCIEYSLSSADRWSVREDYSDFGGFAEDVCVGLGWPLGRSPELRDDREGRVVRLNMKEAQDRQKSYADRRRRELEFQVGDRVYLKMAMLRGPNRSIAENKLSPRFMGPFPVVERVGPLAYRLELPEIMKAFHKVFHVSMLRKCLHPTEELVARIPEDLQPDLTVPAVPVRILERREKVLRNKRIPLLRILWDCSGSTEETWEPEAKMKLKFRKWFDKQVEEIAILNNSSCFWRLRSLADSLGASRPQLSVAYLGASRPQYKQFSSSGCKWASVWTFRVRLGASGPQCGPVWTCLGASGPQYKWFVCLDDELGVKFLERAYDIGFDVCLGDQVRISSVAALRGRVFVVFVTFVGIRGRIQFSGGEL